MVDVLDPLSLNICSNILKLYNIMCNIYRHIRTYGFSENHSGIINIVSASSDIFLNVVSRPKSIWYGLLCWISTYVEQVSKDSISKMHTIIHLCIHCFINSSVLNVGLLIDPYNDLFIPGIVRFIRYGLNTLLNLTKYFKTQG